ncbi:hypothetical protein [Streptomyces phaeochromogenes]
MNAQTPHPAPRQADEFPECRPVQQLEIETETASAIIEARAISETLCADLGVPAVRVGFGIDPVTNGAVVRVETAAGLIALSIPSEGQPYIVQRGGQRLMQLTAVRRRRAQPGRVAAAFLGVLQSKNLV